jgi:hypothetical protein
VLAARAGEGFAHETVQSQEIKPLGQARRRAVAHASGGVEPNAINSVMVVLERWRFGGPVPPLRSGSAQVLHGKPGSAKGPSVS